MFSQYVFILQTKIKPAFPLLILMRFLFSLPVIICKGSDVQEKASNQRSTG